MLTAWTRWMQRPAQPLRRRNRQSSVSRTSSCRSRTTRPWTWRSISIVSSLLIARSRRAPESFERNLRPFGPVVELIADLVDGLVEEVGVQQDPELRRRLRQQRGGGDGREIAFEERSAHRAAPEPRPRLQGGKVFRTRPGHLAE